MRIILSVILSFLCLSMAAQKVDTIIDKGIYRSHFNYALKEPVFVDYKLWQGGGDCSRAGFGFRNDTKIKTAAAGDYAKTGYDIGHMANAEDFADSCLYDEMTFRFYNALPQTPNLNRGIWRQWETTIRKESQTDSLLIVCGGIFSKKPTVIGNGVAVPVKCWKVVQSLTTKKILHVLLFTNDAAAACKIITLRQLEMQLGYKVPVKQ